MKNDEKFIRRTLELAKQSLAHGNQPFAALIVLNGEIIVEAESSSITSDDCTRHSELTAVSILSKMNLDPATLAKCTLYSSTEPCAMCTGAIYWSGIGHLVFGCSNGTLVGLQGDHMRIKSKDILSQGARKVEVTGPVIEEEAMELHKDYWEAPRTWWREPDNPSNK